MFDGFGVYWTANRMRAVHARVPLHVRFSSNEQWLEKRQLSSHLAPDRLPGCEMHMRYQRSSWINVGWAEGQRE